MPAEIGQLYGRAGAVELTKEFLSGVHGMHSARRNVRPVPKHPVASVAV